MAKRSYRQNCSLARASDLIGERWTLLLIRDLLVFPRRFNELLASLKGIGTNLLATRLKDLEAAGLVERQTDEAGSPRYSLTGRGRALEPSVLALIRWGLVHAAENVAGDHHHDDWDLLALKALFQPVRASDKSMLVQFRTTDFQGWCETSSQGMAISLGMAEDPDIEIDGSIADLFLRSAKPADRMSRGDAADLERFMSAFALRA